MWLILEQLEGERLACIWDASLQQWKLGDTTTLVDALKQNGYPLRFIQRHPCCSNLPRPLTLPYISRLSETVKRILGSLDIRVVSACTVPSDDS